MQTEPPQSDAPKPKLRWFQFSLRTLLIVVTLLAVLCGTATWVIQDRWRLIRERDDAIQQARAAGGQLVDATRRWIELSDPMRTRENETSDQTARPNDPFRP